MRRLALLVCSFVLVRCESILSSNMERQGSDYEYSDNQRQAESMLQHPDKPNHVLAVSTNSRVLEINLTDFSQEFLSPGELGFVNGLLNISKFKHPSSMIKIWNGVYAIADTANNCIRRLDWRTQEVSTLAGACGQVGESRTIVLPRAIVKSSRKNSIYIEQRWLDVIIEIDLDNPNDLNKTIHIPADTRDDFCVLGMASSLYYSAIWILVRDGHWVKLFKLDTKSNSFMKYTEIGLANDATGRQDGSLESLETKVYMAINKCRSRNSTLLEIGDHLIALLDSGKPGNILYDFDLKKNFLTHSTFDHQIGAGIYFDHQLEPHYMYLSVLGMGGVGKYLVDRCQVKSQSRPPQYSNTWMRTVGYKCEQIDEQKIESFPYNETAVVMESCFSVCSKMCMSRTECVAFQCDSEISICTLSRCALVDTLIRYPTATCYRLADVVYAPPAV